MDKQADRLHLLNEISRVVSSPLELRTLYDTIYEQVGRVMDTSQFFIALYQHGRGTIDVPYLREHGTLYLDQQVPHGESVTNLVIQHGTPLLFHSDEDYVQYARANGLPDLVVGDEVSEAKIYVPLNTGNHTIGALTVQSKRLHAYTEDDVQTLSVIASQAAIAIENARLYAQSQSSVRQMHALLHVAQMINGSLDLPTVLDAILTGMRGVIPFYVADILLPNHGAGYLEIVGTVGETTCERRAERTTAFGQGVAGRVFQTGEPLVVHGAPSALTSSPSVCTEGELEQTRCRLAMPLKHGGTVVGVLNVEREADAFAPEEFDLLAIFASQAAIAIENARLFSEQQRRVFELQTIQSIVQKLTPLHHIQDIAALIDEELKQLIDYHSCRLFLLDQYRKVLVSLTPAGSSTAGYDIELRVGEGITGWIAEQGESVLIPNTLEDNRVTQIAGTPRREESLIGTPLIYEGKVHGVVTLSKLGINQFDDNAVRLLEIIAAQTAIAFDRVRLHDELLTEAVTDELTKLYNRRHLLNRFNEERSRALRNEHTLAALILDIDKFKLVNDRYGHDAGDVVLRDLAVVIRAVVRAEDIVARHGGEEFCVLMPETSPDDAQKAAERLRAAIERRHLPEAAGVRNITVSVGLALLSPEDEGMEVFTRADLAMYEVKHLGGNRVCLCDGASFHVRGEGEKATTTLAR